jgi:hypothetical protein
MNWLAILDILLLIIVFLLATYSFSLKHRIDYIETWLEDHFDGVIDLKGVAKQFGFLVDDEEDEDESKD